MYVSGVYSEDSLSFSRTEQPLVFHVAGVYEEEDDNPSGVSSLGRVTTFTGRPSSGAEFFAVSTRWGEDSDEGSVRDTPARLTQFGATDHEDVEIGAVFHSTASSPCGSDNSGNDNGMPVPNPLTRWGDESDSDDDPNPAGDARLVISSVHSSILMAAVDADEYAAEGKRSQDEQEPLALGLQQQEEHAPATSWGSDDGDDEHDFPLAAFSQPFRMGAAAAVASIGASSVLSPASGTHVSASWGRDEEEGDGGGNYDAFSPIVPNQADVNAQRLSPVRHHQHRDDCNKVVVAPLWMPHAQGPSELANEPNHSWADESGDDPVFDDVDIATDGELSPRDERLAATYPGQCSTPLTMAPSPWFSTLGRHFKRKSPTAGRGGEDDNDRYPWNVQPATTPSRGDSPLIRWSRPDATASPRSEYLATTEKSPMHQALTLGDTNKRKSPALTPVRTRRSWFRRKEVKEVGSPRARKRKDGEKRDGGSGVRAWGWRDTLQSAPGLVGRLAVCILAVCALWLTSLSVVGDNDLKLSNPLNQHAAGLV